MMKPGKMKPGPGTKERSQPKPFLKSGINKDMKQEMAPTKKASVTRNSPTQKSKS